MNSGKSFFTLVLEPVTQKPFTYFSLINMSISTRMWWTLTLFLFTQHIKILFNCNIKNYSIYSSSRCSKIVFKGGRTCFISQIIVYGFNCSHFIVVTCLDAVSWSLVVSCSLPEYIVKGNEVTIQNLTVI